MKSPAELKAMLRRQWERRSLREARLLGAAGVWPLVLAIGRPSPGLVHSDLGAVKRHVDRWRRVKTGEVIWEAVRYRSTDGCVEIPAFWKLRKPGEWLDACGDDVMRNEFTSMATLAEQTDSTFHSLLIRAPSLWRGKPLTEVTQAARLAMALEPGLARGSPLRALSIAGIDTKFFERNERLVTAMLDVRFDGEVSKLGLAAFLDASAEDDRWLLVIDLDGSLLSFRKQRVRRSELQEAMLPGDRLLIVENESCQHQLPCLPNTIAVLGAGFDLNWASNSAFAEKRVAYWGDIDTWGLQFLAKARQAIGHLDALMMTAETYKRFAASAVAEPVVASVQAPAALSPTEQCLYRQLLNEPRGRLEQEFLPAEFTREVILGWADK